MTSETKPIWKDPVAHFMGFALATVGTGFVLLDLVMVEHVWPATMPVLEHYLSPLVTAPMEIATELVPFSSSLSSPSSPISFLLASITILFGTGFALLVVVTVLFAVIYSPFIVSYVFWRHLVYERLYKPFINRGDLQ